MPRSGTTGVYTRVANSFSNPVFGTLIDPTDADAYFDDLDVGLNPPNIAGPLNVVNGATLGAAGTIVGTLGFFNATSGSITLTPPTGALGAVILTFPNVTDVLVGRDINMTLTNKTLTSPAINGATILTSTYNKVTITAPATSATLTLIDGTTLTGPAASGTVMTLGNTETVTGVKTFGSAGAVGRLRIAGTTSGTTILDATAVASGTLTLPAATDTLVGKATTDTLTNKSFDTAGTGNFLRINGTLATAVTGSNNTVVMSNSPTLVTPALGTPASGVLTNTTGYTVANLADVAWATYTPTVTSQSGTFTSVSATGRSKTIGKVVHAQMEVTITTAGTAVGYMQVTLPFTAASNKYVGVANETAATGKGGTAPVVPSISSGAVLARYADGLTMIANGNVVAISITYEIP